VQIRVDQGAVAGRVRGEVPGERGRLLDVPAWHRRRGGEGEQFARPALSLSREQFELRARRHMQPLVERRDDLARLDLIDRGEVLRLRALE